ncbi:MAG TPA: primosomal protein N' [Candidatus Sulfotelmatobacter sp.]|nr:primosomal protein N' [Candidatus Sulfotelmatobacter sp.]
MFYYHVWVRSRRYHGSEPLTYSFDKRLSIGSIVRVELQNTTVLGFVSKVTTKPKFKTKPITEALDLPSLPPNLIKLAEWLLAYYPAPLGTIAQQLLPENLSNVEVPSETFSAINVKGLPKLNKQQEQAVDSMRTKNNYLLHGVTGSGKTRVYVELAYQVIEHGKSVIILTPEIGLTTPLASSFREVFGNRVVVFHSKQTPAQRRKAWLKCLYSAEPLVVIGPRSSLFLPLEKLGLIVLDEAHDSSYKQEQAPQYLSTRVAAKLASLNSSILVLGSATPLVADYYLSKEKKRPIIELNELAKGPKALDNKIIVVDRKDHSEFAGSRNLSQTLIKEINEALSKDEQVLLFLNRRGTARVIMCDNCGWQALCPHCDLPLTYHGDSHLMRCHSCNYHQSTPSNCPVCNNTDVVFKSSGTKAIVEEIQQLFPKRSIVRFDTDNKSSEKFEHKYDDMLSGQVDIIVGTQMITKGLDLPKLGLVGVLLADTSLYLPDFSSEERTFQLLSQVIGRINRGHRSGNAVIQTYQPDQKVIKYALNSNYKDFYKYEIEGRRKFLFPPFCYLLKVTFRRSTPRSAETSAFNLKEELRGKYKVRIEGPSPAFHERFQDKYQWQLVIKSSSRDELLKVIAALPANLTYDIDPLDLL